MTTCTIHPDRPAWSEVALDRHGLPVRLPLCADCADLHAEANLTDPAWPQPHPPDDEDADRFHRGDPEGNG